tara:strand:+ start:488 stop:1018 length:531 start_codon:yes stop_codon:yes gene_type:complete
MTTPKGIKSIAFQGVYSTARKVLPIEILWAELQRSFARKGKITIKDTKDADILVRAQLINADSEPQNIERTSPEKDPKDTNLSTASTEKFRNILRAGSFAKNQSLYLEVRVEIWNLKTQKKIFENTYTEYSQFESTTGEETADARTHFLLYNESKKRAFKSLAKSIAEKAASDFLL